MFKNIKSLFIIEEDDNSKDPAIKNKPKEKEEIIDEQKSRPIKETPTVPTSAVEGQVKKKFTDILFKAMEKANIEGLDYMEFRQSLQSLKKMPMDEATRYKSAFAMAQSMGATPGKLIETADYYKTVMKGEENKFQKAVKQQQQKQIGDRQAQVEQLKKVINEKAKQIRTLTQQIEQHQKDLKAKEQQISSASVKVKQTQNDFLASYKMIVSQIDADIENMKKYLK